jgi:hypothetical protein
MNLKQTLELGQKKGFDNVGECMDYVLANWRKLMSCRAQASESFELIYDEMDANKINFEMEIPEAMRILEVAPRVDMNDPIVETAL